MEELKKFAHPPEQGTDTVRRHVQGSAPAIVPDAGPMKGSAGDN